MNRTVRCGLAVLLVCVFASVAARAEVKTEEKSQIKFEGMLGRMFGLFGGKAAREGLVSTVALKGDRQMTTSESTGQIVDLAEEKVYELDMKKKTYTVTTFAEMRRRMEEARRKAAEQQSRSEGRKEEQGKPEKEMEVDFSLKETGQKRTISGHDTREVLMTVAVREKGKTIEQSGGIVMTSNLWLAPKIAAMDELAEFNRRYAEKLYGTQMLLSAEQMAAALAMFPGLKEAMERAQKENVNMDGTALLTVMKFEAVKSAEQAAEDAKREESGGGGGLGGMLARKMMRKKDDDAAQSGRATILTMNHEVLKVSPAVTDADVAIPAGFKQK
jgi:hypothetical protein